MVVPIGELVNITFFNSSSNTTLLPNTILLTVNQVDNTEIDIQKGWTPNNYDEVRGRSLLWNSNISRDTLMFLTNSAKPYHEKIARNNDMDVNNVKSIKDTSLELSYESPQEKEICFSTVAEKQADTLLLKGNLTNTSSPQCVPDKHSASTPTWGLTAQNINSTFINIQLLYDPNVPTDPEIWDGNFHSISLYSSIQHIGSNAKSIKESLKFMTKYITNKKINSFKVNEFDNFNSMGEAI